MYNSNSWFSSYCFCVVAAFFVSAQGCDGTKEGPTTDVDLAVNESSEALVASPEVNIEKELDDSVKDNLILKIGSSLPPFNKEQVENVSPTAAGLNLSSPLGIYNSVANRDPGSLEYVETRNNGRTVHKDRAGVTVKYNGRVGYLSNPLKKAHGRILSPSRCRTAAETLV